MGDLRAGQALEIQDAGDCRLLKIENTKQYVRRSSCGLEKLDFSLRASSGSLLWSSMRRAEAAESGECQSQVMSKALPSYLSKIFLKAVAAQALHQERHLRPWSHIQPSCWVRVAQIQSFMSTQGTRSKSNTKHFWLRNVFTAS